MSLYKDLYPDAYPDYTWGDDDDDGLALGLKALDGYSTVQIRQTMACLEVRIKTLQTAYDALTGLIGREYGDGDDS